MLARVHLVLGLLVAVPTFFWAASGLLYSLPGQIEGSRYARIDPSQVRVPAAEALRLAGKPVSALTLQNRNGRNEWSAVAGTDEVRVDAITGEVEKAPADARTAFFRQAHFWWFLGGAQRLAIPIFALLCCASSLTGLWLARRALRA